MAFKRGLSRHPCRGGLIVIVSNNIGLGTLSKMSVAG